MIRRKPVFDFFVARQPLLPAFLHSRAGNWRRAASIVRQLIPGLLMVEMVRRAIRRAFAAAGAGLLLTCAGASRAAELPWKVDEQTAQLLAAEGYGHGMGPERFDFQTGMSHRFFEFDGLNQSSNGSFGFFAVNPWTGDVWALWGCHKLSTPALRKSQAEIRRRSTREELKQYPRLSRLEPDCIVED